jgi:acyl-CoA synthetase (AMP-forming)/AMP-acid ligase II
VPEEFVLVDGFERTPMGKIAKAGLRERLRAN